MTEAEALHRLQLLGLTFVHMPSLTEFIGYPEPPTRQGPFDVCVGTGHPTTSTLDATLIGDLDPPVMAQGIDAYGAEVETRLVFTAGADVVILDSEVGLLFIDEILQSHEEVIDIDLG